MALKKSDLYGSLWKSCDELRGGMDASQYKDYILTLLFVKYVSDKAKTDPNSLIDVPTGGSFDDLVTFKGDKEIGDKFNKVIGKLAEANDLQKVIDLADFNDEEKLGKGKEMQDRLTNLVAIFQDLDFRGSRAEGDDLLGDAYEYLMRHFATESGKSKGQFYTPAEVSRVMAKIIGITPDTPFSATVYDPTCGSGSLLLKVADEAPNGLTIYGQEKDNATWALAKMNMILHSNEIADIRKGDTITSPQFTKNDKLETFDFLVANPPFSVKSWSNGLEKDYGRFEFGMPPAKNGDFAFLLHMLKSLKSTGKAAVILPHGVLFRGNVEGQIRKEIVRRGYVKGIIGLPANLFYGTGINACIVVLDKRDAQTRTGIFMIDASKGFVKDGPKNRLRPRDMHKIIEVFTEGAEVPGYSCMIPLTEISNTANDYNLHIPRYIDSSEPEDIQDLHAHLHGGIPNRDIDALEDYWTAFPTLRQKLFRPLRDGYSELAINSEDVQVTIIADDEYVAFRDDAATFVEKGWADHRAELAALGPTTRPSELIESLTGDLLAGFKHRPLVDEYAVYEQLMSYWNEIMHDDVALIMWEGWDGAAKPRKTIEDKDRKISEIPDLIVGSGRNASKYKMDLIPPALIVARYLQSQQGEVDDLDTEVELASQEIEEFVEGNSGDEGLLAEAFDDGKISKKLAAARLREARLENSDPDEITALAKLIALYNVEAAAKKKAKEAGATLDSEVLARYGELIISDIQSLVIDEKWGTTIARGIDGELTKLMQKLTARITTLSDRYLSTLDDIEAKVAALGAKVKQHLADMGETSGEERFRDSEVGRIPMDWSVTTLGSLCQITSSKRVFQRDWRSSGVPFYRARELAVLSERGFVDNELFIDPEMYEEYTRKYGAPRAGDLLITGVGTLGKTYVVRDGDRFYFKDGNIIWLKRSKDLDPNFLEQLFQTPALKAQVFGESAGTTVGTYTITNAKNTKIPFPSLAEQQRIAATLCDVDALVRSIEQLIEKKQAIEQGMMQELLTGRTRLVP